MKLITKKKNKGKLNYCEDLLLNIPCKLVFCTLSKRNLDKNNEISICRLFILEKLSQVYLFLVAALLQLIKFNGLLTYCILLNLLEILFLLFPLKAFFINLVIKIPILFILPNGFKVIPQSK